MYKAKFKNIRVSAVYVGDEAAPFMPSNYHKHRVSVYNVSTHKRTSFKFWASVMNPELRSRYEVLNALYCFVSDAVSGLDSFENFCGNFGYDKDSRLAWQGCQRSSVKALRVLGVSRAELYDFLNELSEVAA